MNARNLNTVAAAAVITNVMDGMVQGKTADLIADIRAMAGEMAKVDKKGKTATVDAGKALEAAGGDTPENKAAFYRGYIFAALALRSEERVSEIMASAGHGRKMSKKQTRCRTEAEETAYGSARVAYHRAVATFVVKESAPRPEGNAEPDAPKVTVTSAADAAGNADAEMTGDKINEHIRLQATSLLQLLNKHAALTGIHPVLRTAVAVFADRVANADDELEASYK